VIGPAQRDVPLALRELANPNIRRLSKSTLVTSLDESRKAVERRAATANTTYKANE